MKIIEETAIKLINKRLENVMHNHVTNLVTTCLREAVEHVEKNLEFVMKPAGDNSFKLEALWKDGHGYEPEDCGKL